jgi:dienelactone hydrolase
MRRLATTTFHASSRWLAAAFCVAAAAAQAVAPSFRIEAYSLPTLTLTRAQLLAGRQEGATAATIAGELSLPFVAAARMPAVLMLHGDAGAIANQVVWREELNALGIAVFTLDSFSGRGAVATGASFATMPDSIGGLPRVVDAERALALLAAHPRIDPARIAVMGFSSGGNTVLAAAQTRFASAFGTPGLRFAAYIALYPDCNLRLNGDTRSEPGPRRIFIGKADVLTSAAACGKYAERLRAAGADIATSAFEGAHHGFDNVSNPDMIRVADVPTGADCALEETAAGEVVNVDTGRPLSLADKCIGKGLVAGYNPAADAATKAAVKALLIERFGLKP